jgi:phosphopantothenate synthetase
MSEKLYYDARVKASTLEYRVELMEEAVRDLNNLINGGELEVEDWAMNELKRIAKSFEDSETLSQTFASRLKAHITEDEGYTF